MVGTMQPGKRPNKAPAPDDSPDTKKRKVPSAGQGASDVSSKPD